MSKQPSRYLLIAGGATALLLLLGVLFIFPFVLDRYQPRLEKAASAALGQPVTVGGDIGFFLLPAPGIALDGIGVANPPGFSDAGLLSLDELRILLDVKGLLRRRFGVQTVEMRGAELRIEEGRDGVTNLDALFGAIAAGSSSGAGGLPVQEIKGQGAAILFQPLGGEESGLVQGIEFSVRTTPAGNPVAGDGPGPGSRTPEFAGELHIDSLAKGQLAASDLSGRFNTAKGVLTAEPVSYRFCGGTVTGSLRVDWTGEKPAVEMKQSLRGLRLEELTAGNGQKFVGELNGVAELQSAGADPSALLSGLQGSVAVTGSDLLVRGYDLDLILRRYDASQNIDLLDLGAFLLVGPFGPVLTKGANVAAGLRGIGGETRVTGLRTNWIIRNGIAGAEDVAFTTAEHRIAARGKLNLLQGEYENFTIAVIDENGCARYKQRLTGPFDDPRLEAVSLGVRSLTGAVASIFKRARDLLAEQGCEPFYRGALPHPGSKGAAGGPVRP